MPNKPDMDAARRLVCEFMEPRPPVSRVVLGVFADWWQRVDFDDENGDTCCTWEPLRLDLDRLHLVEERLTEEQWDRYRAYFTQQAVPPPPVTSAKYFRLIVNATADQKVMALAGVVEER